ncbi:MAG: hypothetical protein FI729_01860 [SAR202 cluster bacterium]|nr:hypothetical protein [SAR202 cluster bacterium]
MPSKIVVLSDRIKELSQTTGTTNIHLEGAANGFSAFRDFYSHGDLVYYAVTDGTYYEVGSGEVQLSPTVSNDQISRFPFRAKGPGVTVQTDKVSWPIGVKEVYVTYPAPKSVYTAFGLSPDYNMPAESGFAFWSSSNILNYDSNILWDSGNARMGISTISPDHAIHVGGNTAYSIVKASGFVASESGLFFPEGNGGTASYSGGRQLEHFVRNKLDDTALSEGKIGASTGASAVIQLSGVVDQYILLKQQSKGTFLSGPPNGCGVDCSPDYPTFRAITVEDIPSLSSLYLDRIGTPASGNVAFWKQDDPTQDPRVGYDSNLFFDDTNNRLGVNTGTPAYRLHVDGNAGITSDVSIGGNIVVSGNLDIKGDTTYVNSTVVTIADKVVELASMSGNAIATDAQLEAAGGAGISVKSSDSDKSILWRSNCDAWQFKSNTGGGIYYNAIDVSGVVFGGDCTNVISGSYQAGSGLSLHSGREFNIGNMFSIGTNPSQSVHQADTIWVSGVSGVATTINKVGANHVVWVDPTELSGILSGGSASSLLDVSGILDNYIDKVSGEYTQASGALNNQFVSGSGALNNQFVSGSGALNNQFVSGSGALDNYIDFVSGELNTISGVLDNYIDKVSGEYASASGALNNKIDASIGTVSVGELSTTTHHAGVSGLWFTNGKVDFVDSNRMARITIAADAAGALDDLSDVTITSVADKHILQYSSTSSKFVNVLSPSGALNNDIETVSGALVNFVNTEHASGVSMSGVNWGVAAFASGQVLSVSGSLQNSINTNATDITTASGALAGLINTENASGVSMSGALDNYIDFVSGELNSASGSLSNAISASFQIKVSEFDGSVAPDGDPWLGAVSGLYFTNGAVTKKDSGKIAEINLSAGAAGDLTGLTDTNITSIADKQILRYDSGTSKWINDTSPSGSLKNAIDVNATDIDTASGALVHLINTEHASGVSMSGVNWGVAAFASGQVLSASGSLQNSINTNASAITANTDLINASGASISGWAGSLFKTAGSGLRLDGTDLVLQDPDADYDAITSSTAVGSDQILVWDDSDSRWKHMSLTEMNAEMLDSAYVSESVVNPGTDYVLFLDGGGTGTVKKESWVDFANLIAGDNIDTDDDGVLDGNAGGVGGDINQNAFSYIKINDNADTGTAPQVEADTTTDTVDFIAGEGVTITSSDTADSVTWAAPNIALASGALVGLINIENASGVSMSGALDNYIDFVSGEFVSGSGANTNAITSNTGLINTNISNIAANATTFHASGHAISGWAGSIVATNTASIATNATAITNNTALIHASGNAISGVLDNYIDKVSGEYVHASGALNNRITSASGALNNQFISGSGALNNRITSASGALNNQFVSGSGALNNRISNLSADSGVIRVDDEFRLNPNLLTSGNGTFLAIGTQNANSWNHTNVGADTALIGTSAGKDSTYLYQAVGLGSGSLYQSNTLRDSLGIGTEAGRDSSGVLSTVSIGYHAGHLASGTRNLAGNILKYSNELTSDSVSALSTHTAAPTTASSSLHRNSVFIGRRTGEASENTLAGVGIGTLALGYTRYSTDVVAIGAYAGAERAIVETGVYIGKYAGSFIDTLESPHQQKGQTYAGGIGQVFIGPLAGRFNAGNANLSLIANMTYGDLVNSVHVTTGPNNFASNGPLKTEWKLNIGNMIYGDHSQGSAGTTKRLIIGKISTSESLSDVTFALHDLNATLRVIPGAVDMHALRVDYFNATEPPTCGATTSSAAAHTNAISTADTGGSARMVTQTNTDDTVFDSTSNEYTGGGHGPTTDDQWGGKFYNTSSDGTMAVIGRNGFPIIPSFKKTLHDPWIETHSASYGYAERRQEAMLWFEKKYNPYDYEIGTMIFAQFSHGPDNTIWPYLLILGIDSGTSPEKKWRFIPMWDDHIIEGRGAHGVTLSARNMYGFPTRTYFDNI